MRHNENWENFLNAWTKKTDLILNDAFTFHDGVFY